MTLKAVVGEDGPHIAIEVDLGGNGGKQPYDNEQNNRSLPSGDSTDYWSQRSHGFHLHSKVGF